MDIEKQIKVLEIIESIPMPPDPAPIPTSSNGYVKVPFSLVDYFDKIGVKLKKNNDGKMKTEDYIKLLAEHNIPIHGKIISYQLVTVNEVIKKKKGNA